MKSATFTHAQLLCVPVVLDRQSILLTSPTGSGKTLAGFLGVFDFLLRKLDKECRNDALRRSRTSRRDVLTTVQCIYVSPLRALAYDIEKNLRSPIVGMGLDRKLSIHLRTGDTTQANRAKFRKEGAHFLVTTPESLAVMLAQKDYAAHFRNCQFVMVDELHSFAGNKRGADLTISLERLEYLRGIDNQGRDDAQRRSRTSQRDVPTICRIGLSATAAPLDLLAHFLVGQDRPCLAAEARVEKKSIVDVFSPIRRDPYPPAGYTGVRLYAELADLIRRQQSVLVFTNVRSAAEQIGLRLKELLPELSDQIETHHASLDRSVRLEVEDRSFAPIATEQIFALVRRAYPFRDLTREEFDQVLRYLEGGGESLTRRYSGLFGKIKIDDGIVSLAHPRVARDLLVNIGTIVSDGFVDVLLKRRRLGSVEENFIKQLNIGDLFVLAGRVVRLIDTGVNEAFVERADGQLPTVPRWNAAKMPLTSGVARAVRKLRTKLATRLEGQDRQAESLDWLVENYGISIANAQAIIEQFWAQMSISEIPVGRKVLIELYRNRDYSHYFFHSLIGRSANDAVSRVVAWRVKERIGGNALVTIDDYGFLLTLRPFQEMPLKDWRICFGRNGAEETLGRALRGSELVKWQFRGVAQTGLMVPRNLPGRQRKLKQLSWSAEVLFRVLEQHEPRHPLLVETYRQAAHTFLDAPAAYEFLEAVSNFDWKLRELAAVSPFAFPIYASVIKESMMLEDPATAIDRIYREMYDRVKNVIPAADDGGSKHGHRRLVRV